MTDTKQEEETPKTSDGTPSTMPDPRSEEEKKALADAADLDDRVLANLEKGMTASEAVAAAKQEPSEEEDADQKEGGKEEDDGKIDPEEYELALSALKRGLPASMRGQIKDMTKEQILEAGLALAKHQAEQDRVGNELAALKAGQKADKDGTEGEAKPEGAEGGKVVAQPDAGLDFSAVLEPLDPDLYGKELPETLSVLGNTLASRFDAAIAQAVETLNNGFAEYVLDQVRRQEGGKNPLLRDDEAWKKIRLAMAELEPGMKFSDELLHERTERLLDRALHAEYPKEMAKLASKSSQRVPKRNSGQPEDVRSKRTDTEDRDPEQALDTWLETRERTGSARAANDAAGFNF